MDGHSFIETAVGHGAIAVICETMPEITNEEVTYVQVEDSAVAAGYMSHHFFSSGVNISNVIKPLHLPEGESLTQSSLIKLNECFYCY